MPQEVVDIFLAHEGLLDDIPADKIHDYLKATDNVIRAQNRSIYEDLEKSKVMSDETAEKLKLCSSKSKLISTEPTLLERANSYV